MTATSPICTQYAAHWLPQCQHRHLAQWDEGSAAWGQIYQASLSLRFEKEEMRESLRIMMEAFLPL